MLGLDDYRTYFRVEAAIKLAGGDMTCRDDIKDAVVEMTMDHAHWTDQELDEIADWIQAIDDFLG